MPQSFFDEVYDDETVKVAPLAQRMRPQNLSEFIGQEHITGEGKLLSRMIRADKISSMILYGPPGTGKTTLSQVIANATNSNFVTINAVTSGVKDIKDVIDRAKKSLSMYSKKTILFIDEIHRFNKAQQDALLPSVEDGTVVLIGATTENPYFEINSALISRSTVFGLKALEKEDIKKVILRALKDVKNGLGSENIILDEDALSYWANISNGDARSALNALELAYLTTPKNEDGSIHIDFDTAVECTQQRSIVYDKTGENHYDNISAFIKSMRGSDPDAAVYYLMKMLYAGEDPKFIARRMVIFASEDISLANSEALNIATSCFKAVEVLGMPECQINLSHAAIYLALSPKSNSTYMAMHRAQDMIKNETSYKVPYHLRNKLEKDVKKETKVEPYKYPHDYPYHWVDQSYLPDELKGTRFYEPGYNGQEKRIVELHDKIIEYSQMEQNKKK